LSNIQKAIGAITASCIQHADDITQIPEFREKYESLRKEVENKDITIANLQTAFDVLDQRAAYKDQAVADDIEANLAEGRRLEQEKIEFEQQKKAAAEALKEKESKLKAEATKTISRRVEEQDKKFSAQRKVLENDIEKRKKDQEEELGNLKTKTEKDLETIGNLKAQIDKLRFQSKKEVEKYEDEKRLKEVYRQDIEGLEGQLKDLQEEFSLNSEPLKY
jgi:chromosome segregation ATPase